MPTIPDNKLLFTIYLRDRQPIINVFRTDCQLARDIQTIEKDQSPGQRPVYFTGQYAKYLRAIEEEHSLMIAAISAKAFLSRQNGGTHPYQIRLEFLEGGKMRIAIRINKAKDTSGNISDAELVLTVDKPTWPTLRATEEEGALEFAYCIF